MMFLEESTTEETIFLTFKLAELPTSVRLIGLFMRTSLITSEVLPAAIPEINKKRCWLNGKNKTLEKKKLNDFYFSVLRMVVENLLLSWCSNCPEHTNSFSLKRQEHSKNAEQSDTRYFITLEK